MTHGSHYLGKLYNDLIANSPQTISIDIPSDMGKGRIAQTQIKHGIIFSDWQMCYQSDMNVQGTVSKDYMQIIFCLNDGISWGIIDEKRSITIQKNESCIYAGHGGTEYACYKKDSNFSFKSIKIPIAYFSQLLTDYFDGQEAAAYEKKLLDGISKVAMKKDSMTALVGPSGSGKSTIANLLARLWDVKSGSIIIRGMDIQNVPLAELMEQISMVFQRVYLFQDTIYNNISIGKPDATEEEVYAAAKKARCYDFIMALPDGFQTVVGEGGATLSGGEKQRISIARCILKDAPIIILDEATASVDTDNESYIQEAISELVKGKTLLVIAHRLNTIQNADQILVIDNGQIAQQGTHEELLKQPGIYQEFVNIRKNAAGWSLA